MDTLGAYTTGGGGGSAFGDGGKGGSIRGSVDVSSTAYGAGGGGGVATNTTVINGATGANGVIKFYY
jgi:hypothetical protein